MGFRELFDEHASLSLHFESYVLVCVPLPQTATVSFDDCSAHGRPLDVYDVPRRLETTTVTRPTANIWLTVLE